MSRWVVVSVDAWGNEHVIAYLADSVDMTADHAELRREANRVGIHVGDSVTLTDVDGSVEMTQYDRVIGSFEWRK